jgi:hypothetical protein
LLGIDQQTAATLIALQKSSGLDLAKLLASLYTEERGIAGGKYVNAQPAESDKRALWEDLLLKVA